jgi:hypothetical protein
MPDPAPVPPAPKPRRWFQIHLSTAVVLMMCAGVCMGFAVHVHLELNLLKCNNPSAAIGQLHVDAMKTPESLTEAVRLNFIRGDLIAVVSVSKGSRFSPSKGPDGVNGRVAAVLHCSKNWIVPLDESVCLYPFTETERVILLQHAEGNWIAHSQATEDEVKRTLQRLSAIEEKLDNNSLERYLYENPVGALLLAIAGLTFLVIACERLIRRREARRS